ncbi:MAG: sulfatase-like hydrolase/transferase [Candidatus Aminicenantes bacterium]|nr:MAG: sulfatase-like hydrolase/transferase [Candidatus Aminicenantes bacterium]
MKHQKKSKKKKTIAFSSIAKRYLPIIGILAALAMVFYLLFWPKLSIGYKKKQLKNLNVILITLDTLRVDFVSAYEKGKADTPNMDRVAEEGVLFETCIAQTPLTLPSHTSILSGTYPLHHQIRDNGGFLVPEGLEFVSEILKKHGLITSAFIASYVLHSKWGINQGFDTYSDEFDLSKYERVSLGNVQKPAQEVLENAKKWLKTHKKDRFFTWIHLYDPHTPYDPPSPFKEKYPGRPYRGEVEYMDHQLGLFFQFLKDEGLYDKSLIIMASDHGEGLGQHNERTHGFFIYETTVRVPLIIRAPFRFPAAKVTNIVELIDLAPTILEALDIPIPPSYQGQSLVGLMLGDKKRKKDAAYTETYYPRLHFGWSELKALYYDNHWKYILAPKEELYNLEADEKEQDSLALKQSYQARKVKERIRRFIREKSQHAKRPGEARNLDKDDLQKLAALGYLTTMVDTADDKNLPDPKGKVEVFNQLSQAKEHTVKEQHDEAIELLKKILKTDPHLVDGILQLGNAYSRKNMHEEALKCFYQVLEQKPDYQAAMVNVIGSLIRLGRYDKGIEEARRFLKTFPRDFTLYNELGTLYVFKQENDKALEAFGTSIDIESINPQAFNKIGGIYIVRKDFKRAEHFLEKARKINPGLRKLYFHLAQVEDARGNIDKACQYYKKELESYPDDYKSAYNLAEDLRNRGQYEEAIQYYRKAIDSNPRFNIPYFMIAKYYLDRRDNLEEAVELCKKGTAIEPANKYTAFGYFILADIYSFKGEREKHDFYLSRGDRIKRELIRKNLWK